MRKGLIIVFDELINYNKFYEGEIKALYEININDNINFEWLYTHGNVVKYEDISKYLKLKINSLKIYKSEVKKFPFPRSLKTVKALATLRGSEIGTKAAESFEVLKQIK